MTTKGYSLHVNLGASQVRKRLKGHGFGVRKVETDGNNQAVIVHTATGEHLRKLEALFADVLPLTADDLADPWAQDEPSAKQHVPWQIVESHQVYRDPWISVRRDDVIRPDGQLGTHSVVNLKPGVTVLAIDDQANVYLTEEFHYGVGRVTLEAVSGGVEPDEDPLEGAKRELREELGIEAGEWAEVGVVDPFTSSVVSPTRLYIARNLQFGTQALEGTEQIRCVQMPLSEAVEKVFRSEITHSPTCVVILKTAMKNF